MPISKKYYQFVFGALMSLAMSFSISIILTLVNIGFASNFLKIWAKSFLMGFIVAFPISLIAFPIVQKISNKLTEE